MIFMKNKLFILILLTTYILPFGGIGISGIQNNISINGIDSEENLMIDFKSDGFENGFNIFLYFDALPNDLAIEYNREIKSQPLTSTMILMDQNPIEGEFLTFRVSDYLTVRKEIMGFSIPILAKAAVHVGGGLNQHKSVVPSINLLKDIYDVDNVTDLYNGADENWDSDAFIEKLENNAIKSTGAHLQAGVQGKILIFNLFVNAKYTFILNDDKNSIDSFPGVTIGMAYGF